MWLYHRILSAVYIYPRRVGLVFLLLQQYVPWNLKCILVILRLRSYLIVCTLCHLSTIITQTCLKALNIWNYSSVYSVECVPKMKSILNVIFCGMYHELTHVCSHDCENSCPSCQETIVCVAHFTMFLLGYIGSTWPIYIKVASLAPGITKFMGPIWGPPGSCRPQMGPMLAPWICY